MNKTILSLFSLIVVMGVVWLSCDIFQIFVTPLSQLGINHWIPETVAISLFGFDAKKKWPKKLIIAITVSIFAVPSISCAVFGDYVSGFLVGLLFSVAFVCGMGFTKIAGIQRNNIKRGTKFNNKR